MPASEKFRYKIYIFGLANENVGIAATDAKRALRKLINSYGDNVDIYFVEPEDADRYEVVLNGDVMAMKPSYVYKLINNNIIC